jgi:ABC-2 type transport system permease protein
MLSWVIGRDISSNFIFIGITAMTAFFTATALSPVVLPIETREKSLERQMASPLAVSEIILGIVTASSLFASIISGIVMGIVALGFQLVFTSFWSVLIIIIGIILTSVIGSLLGTLVSAYPTDQTSDVMVLVNLLKFPLVFMSGIFVPISTLQGVAVILSYISPVTPFVDILHGSVGHISVLSLGINILIMLLWIIILILLNMKIHPKTMEKRFAAGGPIKGMMQGKGMGQGNGMKK